MPRFAFLMILRNAASVFLAALALAAPLRAEPPLVYEGTAGPGKGRHIVFLSGDHEYRSEETLPALARVLAKHHGFKCTVLFNVDPQTGTIVPGNSNSPGLAALANADLAVVFLRFQDFPTEQMKHVAAYLDRGGPVIGLRTATHAFRIPATGEFRKYSWDYKGEAYVGGFGHQVLGQSWIGHYGKNHTQSTRIDIVPAAASHPILRGVKNIRAHEGGYVGKPTDGEILTMAQPLNGMTPDSPADATKPPQPSEWTRSYKSVSGKVGRVFTSLYGASEDLLNDGYRRMLVNATFWALGLESAITPDLNVALVGPYRPSTFGTHRYIASVKPSAYAGFESPIPAPGSPPLAPATPKAQAKAPLKAAATPQPALAGQPNIVFIFADDWGWGDLSAHGHPWLRTPHLDRLAREGTDFHQFNVLNPVCSPSRAAAMTGMFPSRFGIHQHFATPAQNRARNMPDWLDPRAPSLARLLRDAGYRTAHFGKWHLTNRDTHGAPAPTAYGFDQFAVFNGGAETESADLHATPENAVKFIHANRERPFFLNVWLHESHLPHVPTKASLDKWAHLDEQKRVYAAVITDGDNAVGRVLDALRAAGIEQNTIVMFSSDNGPETTAPKTQLASRDNDANAAGYGGYYSVGSSGGLRGEKRSLFEGGVRVPFLVRWPGRTPAGAVNDTTAFTAVDLLPTLCAAAGVTLPQDYRGDGENLLPAFHGQPVARTRPIFWYWTGKSAEPHWWPRLAVRDGDWKLHLTADAKRVALHRLTTDRAETVDVARAHPEIVARLAKLALDWQASLPTAPDPACISAADRAAAPAPRPKNAKKASAPPAIVP